MKSLEICLKRKIRTDAGTVGDISIESKWRWYSIERSERKIGDNPVCIPVGRYEIQIYNSPHFGYEVPLLLDVPGRTEIEIHIANKPEDLKGCIGVGRTHPSVDFIGESKLAFEELMPIVKDGLSKGKVFITVA